ncbi:hypothetical protein L596_027139 [Steinernema carpocapsae]|nr:hypothetical protein L596_027139 [Steinernema carpocapsae]
MPAIYGAFMRLITLFGNNGSSISMFALAIERTIATLKARSYEQESSRRLSNMLILGVVGVNVGFILYIVSYINFYRFLPMQSLTAEAADPGTM